MKRLAPLAASIMAGLASASGAAICSPTSPQPDRRVCNERLVRSVVMPQPGFWHHHGGSPDYEPHWQLKRDLVPARQLMLLHDSGPRRQAGDPEPTLVQPVEMSGEPSGSLPAVVPVYERPVPERTVRRSVPPLVWALAIFTIMGLVFISYTPG